MTDSVIYWVGQMEFDAYNRALSPVNYDDEYFATHQMASLVFDTKVYAERMRFEKEEMKREDDWAKSKAEWDALFGAGLREKSWDELHPDGYKPRKFTHDYSIEESRLIV